MKTKNIFSRIFFASAILASVIVIPACDKDDNDDTAQTYTLSGDGSGAQESPAVATSATSTLTGSYNTGTNRLEYTVNWTGLTGPATMVHFHGPATVGVNAGVITDLSITTAGITGTASGSLVLADTSEVHLLSGKMYYNIHTAANVDGEVRGQVITVAN